MPRIKSLLPQRKSIRCMGLDIKRKLRERSEKSYAERKGLSLEHVPYDGASNGSGSADGPGAVFEIATYNVHRWSGVTGGRSWKPDLAKGVIAGLNVDVFALQEVLRPDDYDDPLKQIAEELHLHYAFAPTRPHRMGVLGNAILSRWPMNEVRPIDLSFGRLEPRAAVAAQFEGNGHDVAVVATHLAIVDRIRSRQVRTLLEHPDLQGSVVLLGDMNAWRRCPATRELEREFLEMHHNRNWPPSFPATRPVLSLDRIYARNARVQDLHALTTSAAQQGSDHLPVTATIRLEEVE